MAAPSGGTPPRGRGRRLSGREEGRGARNTPARAGTTPQRARRDTGPQEHPRAGGDDGNHGGCRDSNTGTPPRGRGRRHPLHPGRLPVRNTPARAGTTSAPSVSPTTRSEHPRAGGDDTFTVRHPLRERGTPPRGRGRLPLGVVHGAVPGNTPARAGTTYSLASARSTGTEHPRAGGDDLTGAGGERISYGTPPRGRGRRVGATLLGVQRRNTPARAGTTLAELGLYRRSRAQSISPSKSTGYQRSRPAVRRAHPCSFRAGSTMIA